MVRDVYSVCLPIHKFEEADAISRYAVGMHLKVMSRMTTRCTYLLDAMEAHFGKGFSLAHAANIDIICQKTSSKDTAMAGRPGSNSC